VTRTPLSRSKVNLHGEAGAYCGGLPHSLLLDSVAARARRPRCVQRALYSVRLIAARKCWQLLRNYRTRDVTAVRRPLLPCRYRHQTDWYNIPSCRASCESSNISNRRAKRDLALPCHEWSIIMPSYSRSDWRGASRRRLFSRQIVAASVSGSWRRSCCCMSHLGFLSLPPPRKLWFNWRWLVCLFVGRIT